MAQLDACQNGDQEVAGSSPAGSATFFDFRFDSEMFSAVILSLPLIQEEAGPRSLVDKRVDS